MYNPLTIAADLDAAVRAVCPIVGVHIGAAEDKSTWYCTFDDSASDEQKAAAQSVIDNL